MPAHRNPWASMPVHRIGTYTEHGLTPGLVEGFLEEASARGCSIVDPFTGSGVVAVEAQRRCIPFIGIDSNPWSILLARAKTQADPDTAEEWASWAREAFWSAEPLVPTKRLSKYHGPVELEALGRIRRLIEDGREARPLLLAVLARTAYRYSRLRRSPAPRLRGAPGASAGGEVLESYISALLGAVEDLRAHRPRCPVALVEADSTRWLPSRVCGVLTSPPFANNIDYIRHTMLELLWAGYALDSRELGMLRDRQAPACEACARWWRPSLGGPIKGILDAISGPRARGYRRFLSQYLESMRMHLGLLAERLEWEAWYTIGDSRLGGAYIPVHRLLEGLAAGAGLRTEVEPLGPRARRGLTLYLLRLRPSRG